MKRRGLLLGLIVGLVGCASDGAVNNKVNKKIKIVVIGAGVSGLAAAKSMQEKGIDVTVLEGRGRIGGRIWTDRHIAKQPFDMGASWIHGTKNNPMSDIVHTLSLSTMATDYGNSIVYDENGQIDTRLFSRLATFQQLFVQELETLIERDSDKSIQDAANSALSKGGQGGVSLAEVNFLLNSTIEHEFAADVHKLSVMAPAEGEAFSGTDVIFSRGYDQITNYLAEGIDIQLNQRVTAIDYSTDRIKITTNSKEVFADKVLITVPLGVLKKGVIDFAPQLPDAKLHAIKSLGMGVLNKVYLKFPHVFWDSNVHLINYVNNDVKGYWAEWLNFSVYAGAPVLLAFNAGEFGHQIEGLSDKEVTEQAMGVLRKIYGASIPEPTDVVVTRWGSDPFSYGSYSYLKVGANAHMRSILAEPLNNRLFFSGEATSKHYPATVHGAYLSGLREAERILSDW